MADGMCQSGQHQGQLRVQKGPILCFYLCFREWLEQQQVRDNAIEERTPREASAVEFAMAAAFCVCLTAGDYWGCTWCNR